MNVFFHGTIEAGFDVLKAKIEKDMAGEMGKWISEYRLSDLGNKEVMCAMNCTNMDAMAPSCLILQNCSGTKIMALFTKPT